MVLLPSTYFLFFFHDKATTEIYTYLHSLSLHDALPILLASSKAEGHGLPDGRYISRSVKFVVLRTMKRTIFPIGNICRQRRISMLENSRTGIFKIGRAQSELQSLMLISYAVFCLQKKQHAQETHRKITHLNSSKD